MLPTLQEFPEAVWNKYHLQGSFFFLTLPNHILSYPMPLLFFCALNTPSHCQHKPLLYDIYQLTVCLFFGKLCCNHIIPSLLTVPYYKIRQNLAVFNSNCQTINCCSILTSDSYIYAFHTHSLLHSLCIPFKKKSIRFYAVFPKFPPSAS